MFGTATVFLLMSILVEGLHEVDAVAVASEGPSATQTTTPHTTPVDVTPLRKAAAKCNVVIASGFVLRAAETA
jgi:hypothetical protein